MQHNKTEALLILLSIVLFSFMIFKWNAPPQARTSDAPEQEFSADRAMQHLNDFASKPHAGGTDEHARVQEYLVDELKGMGLQVETREGTGLQRGSGYVMAGHAVNIHARLKGRGGKKTVLVMAHYDSQPNTLAAADDGSGVASMLESIRALQSGEPLQNDILFLITDLEESGLLGAERFVYDSLELGNIGIILNFEARGNSGTPIVFEVSPNNGWLMKEFKKAAPHAVANSLGYEVYKRMPNDTDVTMFKRTGITFLNSAFVDGYVNYHSMTDTPDNLNRNTLQHQGTNMLAMIRHFGDHSLEVTKEQDYVFFNPIGHWLVIYPVKLDMVLTILTLILFLTIFIIGYKNKTIRPGSFFLGFGLILASMLLAIGVGIGLRWVLLQIYPHYEAFYSSNFYNAPYYFPVLIGAGMIVISLCFGWALKKFSLPSLMLGALLLHVILLIVLKIYLSSGAYLIHIPLIIALSLFLFWVVSKHKEEVLKGKLNFLMLIPALSFWLYIGYFIHIVFSIELLIGPMIIIMLFTPFVLALILISDRILHRLFLWLSLGLFLGAMLMAHMHSGVSSEQPLQTNLNYALDADKNQASWFTVNNNMDSWNEHYLEEKKEDIFRVSSWGSKDLWQAKANPIRLDTGRVEIIKDTVTTGKRYLTLRVFPGKHTLSVDMKFSRTVLVYKLQDRTINLSRGIYGLPFLRYHAIPAEGIVLEVRLDADKPLEIELMERKLGIDPQILDQPLPKDFIYGPGYHSNTMQVKRTVRL